MKMLIKTEKPFTSWFWLSWTLELALLLSLLAEAFLHFYPSFAPYPASGIP